MKDFVPWTLEEKETLKRIWRESHSLKALVRAHLPRRTPHAVGQYARKIGLAPRGSTGVCRYSWIEDAIVAELKKGIALSAERLSEAIGCGKNQVWRRLSLGHGTKFYVDSWTRRNVNGPWTAKWSLGEEDDAPKPKKLKSAEISRRSRLKRAIKASSGNPFAIAMNQVLSEVA